MMRVAIAISVISLSLGLSLGLCGCVGSPVGDALAGPEKLAARDDAYCRSIGTVPGNSDYAQCRMFATQQRNQSHQSAFAASAGIAAAMQPQRLQTNCTSVRTGTMVQTNCN